MEDDMLKGSMVPGSSTYGGLDLQGSAQINHHQHQQGFQNRNQAWLGSMQQHSMHDVFPLTMGRIQDGEQPIPMAEFNKMDGGKHSASDEEELTFNEEGVDVQHEAGKGSKLPVWHRVKWTDSMVVLLITVVSYMGEDTASESRIRKFANLQKKGKWKTVSKVMAQRGLCVSPQQCEDKFNDLNKRYKKLNDILGRGTCCQVVENPALLNMMDHLSDKAKDEVRKILSSKQLFYEEMCSYHNGNRLHLPPDPALQKSLQLALRRRDDLDEDDNDAETDEHEECEEIHHRDPAKKMKQGLGPENSQEFDKGFRLQPQNQLGEMNPAFSEGQKAGWLQEQSLKTRVVQLEEQKLQIDLERLELEKQRLKWQKFSRKKERELEKRKMENEGSRLENEQMALELKQMEMSINTR